MGKAGVASASPEGPGRLGGPLPGASVEEERPRRAAAPEGARPVPPGAAAASSGVGLSRPRRRDASAVKVSRMEE